MRAASAALGRLRSACALIRSRVRFDIFVCVLLIPTVVVAVFFLLVSAVFLIPVWIAVPRKQR